MKLIIAFMLSVLITTVALAEETINSYEKISISEAEICNIILDNHFTGRYYSHHSVIVYCKKVKENYDQQLKVILNEFRELHTIR